MEDNWYEIDNIEVIDSPALAVYEERIRHNIAALKKILPDLDRLRPHVKTNKIKEIQQWLIEAGIHRFKCATIAEAEMLALAGAEDVLLAYQPVGPKIERLLKLVQQYPGTFFSCLVDNVISAGEISTVFTRGERTAAVWIDLNIGMNRTGIAPGKAEELFQQCVHMPGLDVIGLHAYDGHLSDSDRTRREERCNAAFAPVQDLYEKLSRQSDRSLQIVAGGTPTFPIHAKREHVQCSPGTFIFWDAGYARLLPELPFQWAAVLISRVISVIDKKNICLDLGHKSVAAENPLPRVIFLNVPDAVPLKQNEEHLVVEVADSIMHKPGEVWYGIPVHICPTVALYDRVMVISDHQYVDSWKVLAADRSIGI